MTSSASSKFQIVLNLSLPRVKWMKFIKIKTYWRFSPSMVSESVRLTSVSITMLLLGSRTLSPDVWGQFLRKHKQEKVYVFLCLWVLCTGVWTQYYWNKWCLWFPLLSTFEQSDLLHRQTFIIFHWWKCKKYHSCCCLSSCLAAWWCWTDSSSEGDTSGVFACNNQPLSSLLQLLLWLLLTSPLWGLFFLSLRLSWTSSHSVCPLITPSSSELIKTSIGGKCEKSWERRRTFPREVCAA